VIEGYHDRCHKKRLRESRHATALRSDDTPALRHICVRPTGNDRACLHILHFMKQYKANCKHFQSLLCPLHSLPNGACLHILPPPREAGHPVRPPLRLDGGVARCSKHSRPQGSARCCGATTGKSMCLASSATSRHLSLMTFV